MATAPKNKKRTWYGADRRLGRGRSNGLLGLKMFYVWVIQTLALLIGLVICASFVRDLGGWFTSREMKMFLVGAVVGFSVASYRLMKRKESWNRRAAEMEEKIHRLKQAAGEQPPNPPDQPEA